MKLRRMSVPTKKRAILVLDTIIVVGVIAGAVMGALILKQAEENSHKTDTNQTATIQQIKDSGNRTEKAVACMLTFYTLPPPREDLRITDKQQCIIENVKTKEQRTLDTTQFSGAAAEITNTAQTPPTSGGSAPRTNGGQGSASPGTNNHQNTQQPDNRSGLERATDTVVRAATNVIDKLNPF